MQRKLLMFVLTIFVSAYVYAQDRTISGKVTDEAGLPLPQVSVFLKGTTIGGPTDLDGNYRLAVPQTGGVLVFRFLGYATKEETIGNQSIINVQLLPDITNLEEVVITAVGIEANKASLGYSIENVNPDNLVNSKETNLVNALSSKIAGVSVVSSSGSPGSSANIRIRGNTSINGSNSPLFVVDGIPIDNSSSGNGTGGVDNSNRAIDINPNDIGAMTVLKGPAATALYGIRAANGAIIITTKSGSAGAPKVKFSTSVTMDEINKFPEMQSEWAQGSTVRTNGVYGLQWRGPDTFEGNSWGPRISDLEFDGSDYPFDVNGRLVPAGTGNGVPARAYDQTDFFKKGYTVDNNVSIEGGTDNLKYFFSAGDLRQQGVVPNADFGRTTFRMNLNMKLNQKLSVGASGSYINSGGSRIQRGSNVSGVMLGLLRNTPTFDMGNGKIGQAGADTPSTYILPDGSQRSYRAGIYDNPYWTVNKNPYHDNVNRIIGNVNLAYKLNDWMTLSYKIGLDQFVDERLYAQDINKSFNGATRNLGSVNQESRTSSNVNHDLIATMKKSFGADWTTTGTFGFNYWERKFTTKAAAGTTLAAPNYYNIANATNITAFETVNERRLSGLYGNMNIGWRNQLYLNLSGRNDWSSTLPAGKNSFFYQAISLGWTLSETLDLSNSWLSYAKLRASWGEVGNDAPLYSTSSYFNPAGNGGDGFIGGIGFPAFNVNAFERSTQLGNNQLKPETTGTLEFGLEVELFKGKVTLDVTHYDAETTDQIVSVAVPASTGYTNLVQNAGVISNKGWEVQAGFEVLKKDNFSWNIEANWTMAKSIVEELAEGIETITLAGFTSTSSRVVVGQPYGAIYGTGFLKNADGKTIIGADGYPVLDPKEGVYGNPNPEWTSGIRNTIQYKNFSLSALLDIRKGGDIWCGTCGIIDYFGTSKLSGDLRDQNVVFDGVLADGSPNSQSVPYFDTSKAVSANYFQRYGFGGTTEQTIFDGSWIRLRELTLSYSLPDALLSKMKLNSVKFQLTGRNLWLSTKYPGVDPETNLTGASNGIGLDYFNMPNTRSYAFTMNITF
jgi:TonB-linked SusC/RagA family outer membrane protein